MLKTDFLSTVPTKKARKVYYHASPPRTREAIQREGLKPGVFASYGPPAVYLYKEAYYAEGYHTDNIMDVWAVNVSGLKLYADPEDPKVAYYTTEPIPADRLRLHGTFLEQKPYSGPLDDDDDEALGLTDEEWEQD